MKIVELTAETIDDSINLCIGSKPGDELAREEKRRWLESRMPLRAGGKLAYLDGHLVGMAEFTPIEDSPFPVVGEGLLHINCIWVLPAFQKQGIGEGLLRSCLQEARLRRKSGLSVIGYDSPLFMPSSFFHHQGFIGLQTRGHEELMWKDLEASKPPRFLATKYSPHTSRRRVVVDILYCAQCPWSIKTRERIEKVAREIGGSIRVRSTRTDNRQKVEELGGSRKVFVDGQELFLPAPREEDVRRVLANRIRERRLSGCVASVQPAENQAARPSGLRSSL